MEVIHDAAVQERHDRKAAPALPKGTKLHNLRHSAVTLLLGEGIDLRRSAGSSATRSPA